MDNYEDKSECIICDGYQNPDGYGNTTRNGKQLRAHRVAYCEANGLNIDEIAGKVVMHSCDNPPCINPDHLILGTQLENIKDRDAKGRVGRNYGNTNRAKLTKADVVDIRNRYTPRCSVNGGVALAKEYGVTSAAISLTIKGTNWRCLK